MSFISPNSPQYFSGPSDGDDDLQIEVNALTEVADPSLMDWLAAQLARIASLAGIEQGRLSVALVDDGCMSQLHQQYRQSPDTTDVLSFDLRAETEGPLNGELVICVDVARRQAESRGHDVRLETLLYAVHGLLHLVGYDDRSEAQAQRMHQREDELLAAAGFGVVFDRPRLDN